MSVSASQICPKPEQQKQQGSARLRKAPQGSALCIDARVWCFRILVPLGSLGLRHENLTRISACALQLAFRMPLHSENQPPKPQFYTVPNDKDTLYPLVAAKQTSTPLKAIEERLTNFKFLLACVLWGGAPKTNTELDPNLGLAKS